MATALRGHADLGETGSPCPPKAVGMAPKSRFSTGKNDQPHMRRMIGRAGDRRATSTKPARSNADARPVHANAAGIVSEYGTYGYASTAVAPCFAAKFTAASISFTDTPRRRYGFATNRHEIDHTGVSSTGA